MARAFQIVGLAVVLSVENVELPTAIHVKQKPSERIVPIPEPIRLTRFFIEMQP